MAEYRKPAVAARQLAWRSRDDLAKFCQQCRGDRLAFGDVAAHRSRVTAMAEKIEGHGDVAVARQRFREGLHQLLRAGKTVRDDDNRGRGGGLRLENRDRRFADDGLGDAAGLRWPCCS